MKVLFAVCSTLALSAASSGRDLRKRPTSEISEVRDFVPLQCSQQLSPCTPWSTQFGTRTTQKSLVTIPCGSCVIMDHPGPDLILQKGLTVHGKLILPESDRPLKIQTPHIEVQGELEMQATNKPVDGDYLYKVELVGQDDYMLQPIEENKGACVDSDCNVGKKVIAVAGGKLNVHGIPDNTPTWVKLYNVSGADEDVPSSVSVLILEETIQNKWAPGAEILITSHTTEWFGQQVRRIALVLPGELGFVQVHLDLPIDRPTTVVESPEFAVEVALLSRNIVFEGGRDDDYLHGGQLVVFHTPNVMQALEGVDIVNFGQQGYLGRYPIHFHLCGTVRGALVAKNTIRKSNQRCVVIHGTNQLELRENIAYDTKGHCFLLEDGHETGNMFLRNLGAQTGPPTRVIPNMGTNGYETDRKTSTFWITNPSNIFVGNVAAGALDSGFWFELRLRGDRADRFPDLDPRTEPLTLFKDNVAHSNGKMGLRAYPSGYRPSEVAEIKDFVAYRNMKGIFLHLSRNIKIQGGLLADNRYGLEIDRADNIDVENATFVGVSPSFRDLMDSQGVKNVCRHGSVIGLEHHTWKNDPKNDGSCIRNLTFTGFTDTGCKQAQAIHVDDRMQVPLFDLYTTFKELTFEEGTEKINFCDAIKVGMTPFFTDLDGSFNPRPNPFRRRRRPSTIMANVPALTQFVQNDRRCMRFDESCALYCRRICFRGIQYSVDQAGTEEYLLKVCDATDPSSCAHFPGYFRGRDPTMSGRARMFNAYLPAGEYTAVFVNSYGEEVWPSYVQTRFQQDELCPMALDDDDIKLLEPPVTEETCTQLLQNQDMENSNDNASPWLHRFGGIQVAPGFGSTMSANALTSKRPAESNTIVQHLDSRCLKLMQDEYYEITAWIKLVDKRGRVYNCDPAVEACPFVGLVEPRGRVSVAQVVQGPNKQGFHRLQGTVQITEAIAYSEEPISLFVRSNVDLAWFIDNVSMRWIDDGTPQMKETPDLLTEDFLGVGGLVTMYGGDFP